MTINNINLSMFLEFPGILITIGIFFLLISIVIIIWIYISENKMTNIKASELPANSYNYKQPNDEPSIDQEEEISELPKIQPIKPIESINEIKTEDDEDNTVIDAFENEFNNSNDNVFKAYSNSEIIPKANPYIEETKETDEEEIELL